MDLFCFIGIMLPLIGISIGSAFVFFLKNNVNKKIYNLLIGYAIGIMLASSIFSLLIPSIELSSNSLPPIIGFTLGFIFLILLNRSTSKIDKLSLSVTLHNIPEGMAVGVCFAGVLFNTFNYMEALILSLGIAIQNIPEGSIISMPMRLKNNSKFKSFYYGFLSGVVEPIASIITILFVSSIKIVLPYFLSFASSSMIYVVIEELVPEIHKEEKSLFGIVGVLIGFVFMMFLDITFG